MSLKDPNVVNPKKRKRVAIVISNPATSTTTGWPGIPSLTYFSSGAGFASLW